ncbi:MAG TPA: hypothetical protein VFW38_07705 [Solirubrobacteraceae bacterium]|nr:hypothetical protein [Solirubrobacteraceae bacterium]
MRVPNLGRDDPLQADESPADVAAHLFEQAKETGALVIPGELRAECDADNDSLGGGIILTIYPASGVAGVTCGWRDVENIMCPAGDPRPDNDRRLVTQALVFMAVEMNTALCTHGGRSPGS